MSSGDGQIHFLNIDLSVVVPLVAPTLSRGLFLYGSVSFFMSHKEQDQVSNKFNSSKVQPIDLLPR